MRIDGAGEIEKISKSLHDSLSRGMSFDAINSHKRSLHYVAKKKNIYKHARFYHKSQVPTCVFNNSCYFFMVSCIVREIGLSHMLKGPHHLPNVMAIVKLVPP